MQSAIPRVGTSISSRRAATTIATRRHARVFIDRCAEAQRAMGFENEKDHPEVAPSQFEMNFKYADAVIAADQVQLYKLLARQVASQLDMTASFLPKPVTGVNGNGMHTNLSLSKKGVNTFHDKKGKDGSRSRAGVHLATSGSADRPTINPA